MRNVKVSGAAKGARRRQKCPGRPKVRERKSVAGRDLGTNEELAEPPPYAHTRRSQQEGFDPPAFMVRRSMPYGTFGGCPPLEGVHLDLRALA